MRAYILPAIATVLIVLYFIPMFSTPEVQPLVELIPEQIKTIEIKKDDSLYVFDRQGNEWVMREPIQWKADAQKIQRLIQKTIKTVLENPVTSDRDRYEKYGIDDDGSYLLLKTASTEEKILIGKRGPRYSLVYIRKPPRKEVYLVDASFVDALPEGRDDFLDKVILKLKADEIKAVRWRLGDRKFELTKTEEGWIANGKKVEDSEVNLYLNILSNITASAIADFTSIPKDAKELGSIEISSSDKQYLLALFRYKDEYLLTYNDRIYKISEFTRDDLFNDLSSEEKQKETIKS